ANQNTKAERRDAAENRRRILEAAQRLFDQNGVEQVSMNQIALEARIGPGTLYRRYRNKSELCLELIKDSVDEHFEYAKNYLRDHQDDPPEQRLRELLGSFIRFRDRKLELLAAVEDSSCESKSHSVTQIPMYNPMHEVIVGLLCEMTGRKKNDPNLVFRADMLLYALLKGDSYQFQRDVRGHSLKSFLEQLCLTFFPLKAGLG
ncbi:TetR/AcrR family transcriptional regulator, partial [Treponema sp. OttesenSCG-928-L16]|nr:TetR/AcrR family transcriptional regulator [Treponema sp. OttesenSCG-928-L16]